MRPLKNEKSLRTSVRLSGGRQFVLSITAGLVLALVSPASAAQDILGTAGAQLEAGTSPVSESRDARQFSDPHEAFQFFVTEMQEYRAEKVVASGVMDLSSLSENDRSEVGVERADQLYEILNRTELINFEKLLRPEAGATEWTYRGSPPGKEVRAVVRFVKSSDLGWRISDETVRSIPSMRAQFEGLQTIAAVSESMGMLPYLRMTLRERMPDALRRKSFLLENWQWAGLVGLVLLAAIFDRIGRAILGVILRRLAGRTRLEASEVVRLERPVGIVTGALVFQLLLPILGIKEDLRTLLDLAAGTLATFAGVWAAYRLVDVFSGFLGERARGTENRFDDMLVPLLRRTLKIFVTIVGLVYLASLMSEDLWGVVAGLSIGSLAVGFAARDSIENLFGTFTVLLDKPFQLGDWVVTEGLEGTIEEVGFRSTRIRTFYDSVISVPNRHFISSSVDNLGVRRYRRIKTMLSLTYDTPPEKVEAFCEGVREVLREHPYTRKDYYHVYLNNFSAASLDVLLYCFVECPDWGTELREKQRLFLDILRVAERLNVDFAFPTQTIHVAKPEDLEHPDRPGSDMEGTRRGRDAGRGVARDTLEPFAGERPGPVGYDEAYFSDQIGRTKDS